MGFTVLGQWHCSWWGWQVMWAPESECRIVHEKLSGDLLFTLAVWSKKFSVSCWTYLLFCKAVAEIANPSESDSAALHIYISSRVCTHFFYFQNGAKAILVLSYFFFSLLSVLLLERSWRDVERKWIFFMVYSLLVKFSFEMSSPVLLQGFFPLSFANI